MSGKELFHGQAVNEEAAALRNSVVQPSRDGIGRMSLTVNAIAVGQPRLVHDGCNERRSNAAAPRVVTGEEVLEIANMRD